MSAVVQNPIYCDEPKNGLGNATLVLGILAFVIGLVPIFGIFAVPPALVAIGLSVPALMRATSNRADNYGAAATGLMLSCVSLAVVTIGVLALIDAGKDPVTTSPSAAAPVVLASVTGMGSDTTDEPDTSVPLGTEVTIGSWLSDGTASYAVDTIVPAVKAKESFMTPGPGNTFVAAHVKVTNTGNSTYENASWIGSKVYTDEGQSYTSNPLVEARQGRALPIEVDLKPGGSIDGWIVFEVPATAKITSIVMDDAEWTIATT